MRLNSSQASENGLPRQTSSRRIHFALCVAIFLVAFGVRWLTWHDTRLEVRKVQTAVAENYKTVAQLLREEGVRGFFSSASPLADPEHLGHPPGYSLLLSFVRPVPGASDAPAQLLQIFFDALSAVLIFLIVAELLSVAPALIAGLLAAFSPQLAWNSVLLLPDSLAVFPILAAVYLLVLARKRPRLLLFIGIGAMVGISCWLRANALLMTVFFAAAVALLFKNHLWSRSSLAVVFGTFLIVLPLTVRNAIVFHRFIPVSLGAGQTLLEGIADYDKSGRFGIPETDVGIQTQEAEAFQRPDYFNGLLSPDGIQRERWRLQRAGKVIASHPFWFGGVMVQRAGSMLRLERARLVAPERAWLVIHWIQRMIITAVILPLAVFGVAILIKRKQRNALLILSVVPAYYFCVQSAFHTEYRYVLAINHFLFALAAMGICWFGNLIVRKFRGNQSSQGSAGNLGVR